MTSQIQSRRVEEKESRRQAILDAAEAIIATRGWEEANFGEIAKSTRLSRSLIYVYFPTREALFDAICNRGAVVLGQVFGEALQRAKTGLEQVEAIGRAYYRFSREYPVYFKLHAEQQTREVGEMEGEAPHDYSHPAFELLGHSLARGVADGSISKTIVDLKLTAVSLWTFTHGLLLIAARKAKVLGQMDVEVETLVEHGFSMLRRMLQAGG